MKKYADIITEAVIYKNLMDLVDNPKDLKVFKYNKEDKNLGVQKLKDYFDFRKGQIVNIGLYTNNTLRYYIPIIITKVHEADINGHNTYDYITLFRADCEFISTSTEKERYLWRWAMKKDYILPEDWFIDLLTEWVQDENSWPFLDELKNNLNPEDIFYIDNDKAVYLFN